MASLYTANAGPRPKKAFRAVPQQPDRILDAPDLVDDYYLNLLDWGSSNAVSSGGAEVWCGGEAGRVKAQISPALTRPPHTTHACAVGRGGAQPDRLPLERVLGRRLLGDDSLKEVVHVLQRSERTSDGQSRACDRNLSVRCAFSASTSAAKS